MRGFVYFVLEAALSRSENPQYFLSPLHEQQRSHHFTRRPWTQTESSVTTSTFCGRSVTSTVSHLLLFLRYHVGSLAFGALILTLVQVIRIVLEYLDHKFRCMSQNHPPPTPLSAPDYHLWDTHTHTRPVFNTQAQLCVCVFSEVVSWLCYRLE